MIDTILLSCVQLVRTIFLRVRIPDMTFSKL